MDIHFHEYRTLHVRDNYQFLCPLCGAREHPPIICHVVVYHVYTTPYKFPVNQMMFVM